MEVATKFPASAVILTRPMREMHRARSPSSTTKENLKTATELKAKIEKVRNQLSGLEKEKQEVQAAELSSAFVVEDSEDGDNELEFEGFGDSPFDLESSDTAMIDASSTVGSESDFEEQPVTEKKARGARRQSKRQAAKDEDDFNFAPRDKCIADLAEKYVGYRSIEPDRQVQRSQTFLAGIMQLPDTHELQKLIRAIEKNREAFLRA
jgi:hypothetical protein